MDSAATTVFRFSAEGVHLEFAGTEDFVAQQVERFQRFLQRSVGGAAAAAVAQAPAAPTSAAPTSSAPGREAPASDGPKETLEEWVARRPVRGGRGAIQDRILLFIGYLQQVQGKREVSGDDILWCFQQLGIERPKNLHNALGILKRNVGHLQEGTRRGLYALSPEGRQYVDGRFR
jgi:hypothetical protein